MRIDLIFDKGSSQEDSLLMKGNIFGVFDGYDGLNSFTDKDGKTGGLIASIIAKNEFAKNDKSLVELALEANKKIGESMSIARVDRREKRNIWGTSAAVIRIEGKSFEWLQVQDSLILVIYKDNNARILIQDYDHDKDILSMWRKLADQKKENIRKLLDGQIAKVRNKMNKTFSTLNGDKRAVAFIKKGKGKLENIKHILLFTDGLFIPKENPARADDWNTFVKLFLEGGLRKIKDFVRNLEKGDPKCWKYPRYKQYDDIAAVSISF